MEDQALGEASASHIPLHPADAHLSPREAMAVLNKDFAPLGELIESVSQARAADQPLDDRTYLNLGTIIPSIQFLGSSREINPQSARLNNLIMGRETVNPWKRKHLKDLKNEMTTILNMEHPLWENIANVNLPMQDRKQAHSFLWEDTLERIKPSLAGLDLEITIHEKLGGVWGSYEVYYPIEPLAKALNDDKFTSPREILDSDLQNLYAAMFYSVFRGVANALHYTQRSKPTPEGIATFDPAGLRDTLLPYFTEEEKLRIYSTMKKISAVQGNPEKLREKILPGPDLIPVVSNLSWARILEFSSLVEEYNVEWAVAAMEWV